MKETKRADNIYVEIEKFQDYELTNNIAYEMIIGNDEARLLHGQFTEFTQLAIHIGYFFMKIPKNINELCDKQANENFAFLVMNLSFFSTKQEEYKKIKFNAAIVHHIYKRTIQIAANSSSFKHYDYKKFAKLTPNQLIGALKDELAYFEQKFNSFALFIHHFNDLESYKASENQTINYNQVSEKIHINNENNYLIYEPEPELSSSLFYIKKCPTFTISSELSDNDWLSKLETSSLRLFLQKHPYQAIPRHIEISPDFSRPMLENSNSKLAKVSINFSLPLKDIMEYISDIKKEFDKNINLIKSPIDIALGDFISEQKDTNQFSSHMSKQMKLANMFFIYDAFKAGYKTSYIKQEIDNYFYSEKMENFVDIKKSAYGFDPKTIRKYYQLACKYIDDKKYITLISSNINNAP